MGDETVGLGDEKVGDEKVGDETVGGRNDQIPDSLPFPVIRD